MAIIQDSIPNMIGGVSQQTDKLMYPNQVKVMKNCFPKPIEGLAKRPETEYVKNLFTNGVTHSNFKCQAVFKDNEEYYIVLDGSSIRVFDFNGNQKTIYNTTLFYEASYTNSKNVTTIGYTRQSGVANANVASGIYLYRTPRLDEVYLTTKPTEYTTITYTDDEGNTHTEETLTKVPYTSFKYTGRTVQEFTNADLMSYITTNNPQKDLDIATIGDYTFITNKTVTTALSTDLYPNPYKNAALIFVRQGDAGTDYTVNVSSGDVNKTVTFSTSASLDSNTSKKTVNIAKQLTAKLKTALGTTDWEFINVGSCILLNRKDNASFTISVNDSNADRDLYAFYDTAESLAVLPTVAPNGFILKIIGENVNKEDDYYVQFQTDNETLNFAQGSWHECPAPDMKYKIDAATMPHVLKRESNGGFTFDGVRWTERYAGDEYSAPSPSFIGNKIKEVTAHKGRIGFISGDEICFSDAEDVFSWFKRSVLTDLDTDPISIASNKELTDFQHSLAYNETMYLFTTTSLYNLKGGDIFSNKTVTLDLAKEYQCSPNCKPIVSGSTAMFLFENGGHSRVLELYISDYVVDVREITDAVPQFLNRNVTKIVSDSSDNMVLFLSTQNKKEVGVYSYYFSNNQKVQSSWHTWTFDDDVIDIVNHNNLLYVLWQDSNAVVHLSKMVVSKDTDNDDFDFPILLDNRFKVSLTSLTKDAQGYYSVVKKYTGDVTIVDGSCTELDYTEESGYYKFKTDSTFVYIGKNYTSEIKLGHIYVRQTTQTGATKVRNGILMLKELDLSYSNTGYFKVRVAPYYSTSITSDFIFTGMLLGTQATVLGSIPISDGIFKVPILSKNEDIDIIILNDSFLPSTFLNYDWIGDFTTRV